MGTYRLIRILKAVLPIIVLLLVGIPARKYWISRGHSVSVAPTGVPLAADLAIHTVDLTLTSTDGPRNVFRVQAKEQFYFKDNKHKLRDVHVVIFGEKPGDFDQVITGDQCIYDESTKDVHFTGNVKAQLNATTAVHTEELTYSQQDRTITSPVRTHVEQPGEMTGDADQLKYSVGSELLLLTGNVGMLMSNGESLHTGIAEFQKKENWAAVSGGVYLEATNGWLRGTGGHADLYPGTYRPSIVTIDGDVTSESHSANSPDTLKSHSNSLVSVLTPAGAIQHVSARGDVRAEQLSKGALQTITGSEVESALDERGHVDTIEARQATAPYAKMVGSSGRSLTSAIIQIKSEGAASNVSTITTGANSTLEAGESTIEGEKFHLKQSPEKVEFNTDVFANLKSKTKDGERKSSADKTTATINGTTNALDKLTQTGTFSFREGARSGFADKAVFTEGGNRTELTGHFSFKEGARSGKANRAIFTEGGNTIEMWESVSFNDGSHRGSAAHAKFSNGGDRVDLESPTGSKAIVVDTEKKLEIQAQTISMNQKTNAFTAKTNVITISTAQAEDVRVTAGSAESDGELVHYKDNVDLFRGQTTHIHANSIDPDKNNGFIADGNVDSKMEGMETKADNLKYDDVKKTAVYTGKVHAVKKDDKKGTMILDAADMTLLMESGSAASTGSSAQQKSKLKELQANGNVRVSQGVRNGTGDHLVYDYALDRMTLTADPGSCATMNDPRDGFISGVSMQWTTGGKVTLVRDSQGKCTPKIPLAK